MLTRKGQWQPDQSGNPNGRPSIQGTDNTEILNGTSGNDVIRGFHPSEGDRLDLSGQAYSVRDTANGIVITLGPATAPTGHVTLWQVHTFHEGWVL